MDHYFGTELQEAHSRAYNLEQEVMRAELRIESLRRRVHDLESQVERLQGVQVESTCDYCARNFMQSRKGRAARFCSASCRQMHYKTNREFMAALHSVVMLHHEKEIMQ